MFETGRGQDFAHREVPIPVSIRSQRTAPTMKFPHRLSDSRSLVCGALIAAIGAGSALPAEAGTRFSNRKSRISHRALGGPSRDVPAMPAQGVALRSLERPAAPPAVAVTEPITSGLGSDRKGFFGRLRDKREQRQLAAAEKSRATRDATAAGPTLTARIDREILARASTASTRVVVDISKQRAYLLVGGQVAVDTPVSTARPGKHTPRGTFRISQRVPSGKVSTIYGVEMPYWMRLDNSVFGMHAGYLPGYPASAGCIRLPSNVAPAIFSATQSGTQVAIYSSWNG